MDRAVPDLTLFRRVRRHHLEADRLARRGGVVLAQEALDVTAAHRCEFVLAYLAEIGRWLTAMLRPLVVLPRLERVAPRVSGVVRIAHDAVIALDGGAQTRGVCERS